MRQSKDASEELVWSSAEARLCFLMIAIQAIAVFVVVFGDIGFDRALSKNCAEPVWQAFGHSGAVGGQ